jgi:hypothetical protein
VPQVRHPSPHALPQRAGSRACDLRSRCSVPPAELQCCYPAHRPHLPNLAHPVGFTPDDAVQDGIPGRSRTSRTSSPLEEAGRPSFHEPDVDLCPLVGGARSHRQVRASHDERAATLLVAGPRRSGREVREVREVGLRDADAARGQVEPVAA